MSVLCLTFAPTKRDQMERLGYWAVLGYTPVQMCRDIAAGLSLLPDDEGRTWFDELVRGITERDGLNNGTVHPDEAAPGLSADDALRTAERRVEDALTALAGEPR